MCQFEYYPLSLSKVAAWELGDKNVHLIVMWSVPYNLAFYDAHFGFGVVHLSTKFTRDMLPYWYKRMYEGEPGTFKRGVAGEHLVFKHDDIFVLGSLGESVDDVIVWSVFKNNYSCTVVLHTIVRYFE